MVVSLSLFLNMGSIFCSVIVITIIKLNEILIWNQHQREYLARFANGYYYKKNKANHSEMNRTICRIKTYCVHCSLFWYYKINAYYVQWTVLYCFFLIRILNAMNNQINNDGKIETVRAQR